MLHHVYHEEGPLPDEFSASDPRLPLVKCLGHDLEFAIGEEQADNTFLHIILLFASLRIQVLLDLLWRVPTVDQVVAHGLRLTHGFITGENDVSLSVNGVGDLLQLAELLPFSKEVADSIVGAVGGDSSQEVPLVVFLECAQLQLV